LQWPALARQGNCTTGVSAAISHDARGPVYNLAMKVAHFQRGHDVQFHTNVLVALQGAAQDSERSVGNRTDFLRPNLNVRPQSGLIGIP
jgi:hypothetical protein